MMHGTHYLIKTTWIDNKSGIKKTMNDYVIIGISVLVLTVFVFGIEFLDVWLHNRKNRKRNND